MKITLVTVGKIKEKFYTDAIAEYAKRLSRYCKLEIIQVADEKTPDKASEAEEQQIKDKEGKRILEQIKDGDTIYAWVGPAMTMSLPPQVTAQMIVANIPADYGVPQYYEIASVTPQAMIAIYPPPALTWTEVTATDGTALAMRLTDRNGLIAPIELPVPDKSESQEPESGVKPYTTVNLYARLKGYEQIEAENLQVFADTITNQNLEMIPLSEFPNQWDQTEIFNTPPQNL